MFIFVFAFIAIIWLVIFGGISFMKAHKHDKHLHTNAVIERIVTNDLGDTCFYVSFWENGEQHEGRSELYKLSNTKTILNVGDTVPIYYYHTQAGWAKVFIADMELKSGGDLHFGKVKKVFFAVFFIIMAFALVVTLFGRQIIMALLGG